MSKDNGSSAGELILMFGFGAVVGAAVALLFAPQSGETTRQMISDKAREGRERVTDLSRRAAEQATTLVDRGREAVNRERSTLEAAYEAGRQAYRQEKEKA